MDPFGWKFLGFLDRKLPRGGNDRHVRIILRAIPKFHNRPSRANVKVAVEYDNGIKTHFAQCVVFLKDSQENFFVVVQWYDPVGRQPFDSVSGLAQIELRPPGITKSYSVMPVTSIVNGALITRSENKLCLGSFIFYLQGKRRRMKCTI